jgi:hypothetical protein
MDPITILAAFGPLLVDGGKALIQKYFAPDEFKPTNVNDYISMRQFDLDMFKALNDAGGANPSYQWVEAVVRLMRPTVAIVVLITWASAHWGNDTPALDTSTIDNFAAAIGFYLFGDRSLFYARKGMGKAKG